MSDFINVLLIAIIILQGLTIFLILGKKKQGHGSVNRHKRPAHAQTGEKNVRKDATDPRRNGNNSQRKPHEHRNNAKTHPHGDKPKQHGKPQQNQSSAAEVAQVEMMSLRAVNLELRDQESAKKKRPDNAGPVNRDERPEGQGRQQNQNRPQRSNGNGGANREERPDRPERQDMPNDRLPRREPNRDGRSENRPPRPERPDRFERPEMPERYDRPERQNRFERPETPERYDRPERSDKPSESSAPMHVNMPQTPEMPPGNTADMTDDMQHGRRFTAKRRQLPGDVTDSGGESATAPSADADVQMQTNNDPYSNEPSMFGRR